MLRRLHPNQPDSFDFTPANLDWAKAQITKYPEGRQASAIIPLLWRAQEQEGWLSRPAIEKVAEMLDMAYIRALEVATFYFMFQLQPTGSIANIQVCGTTTCMICGAEDLVSVCKDRIAAQPHTVSTDGKFTWEEVECLGACSNAPMVQIGKDYYEDLTAEKFAWILDELSAGRVPTPGPQNGRFASNPLHERTTLSDGDIVEPVNGSLGMAQDLDDTVKRIDGTEAPILTPWLNRSEKPRSARADGKPVSSRMGKAPVPKPVIAEKVAEKAPETAPATPAHAPAETAPVEAQRPAALDGPREGGADDLKRIKGVGPKMETLCNSLGFYHFDQIAAWTPSEIAWVDDNLAGFKGRVTRDNWVEQAKLLASGEETEFSKRVDKGGVY